MIGAMLASVAGVILAVLAVKIIGRMRARGAWGSFILWLGVGIGGMALVAIADTVPTPAAAVLLILSVLLWSQRKRWAWQARNTTSEARSLTAQETHSVVGAGKK